MTKWSGYYKIVQPEPETATMLDNQEMGDGGTSGNYSWYNHIVQGNASRLTQYREYDLIDGDVDISISLDTIAEEMTGNTSKSDDPIILDFYDANNEDLDHTLVSTVNVALEKWSNIHDWETRLFHIARRTIKYGDTFFLKEDLLTKWQYIHAKNVIGAVVNEDNISDVLGWQVKKDIRQVNSSSIGTTVSGYSAGSTEESEILPSNNVVRFSLNDDMSDSAPFGESLLKPVYKSQKQKELLEDSIIIYRIQRAPERRVFYIDVGKLPPARVKQYLEQIKNEIRQKKIPARNRNANNSRATEVDSIYNPQSMCLDLETKIPLLDGRVLTLNEMILEHKSGKQNWVYSINPETGEPAPGIVSWAGITRKDTEMVKLTLDNGEEIICTPDHKFPVQGCGFEKVEAQNLVENDSLFPFRLQYKPFVYNSTNGSKYPQIYNTNTKKWVHVHRIVAKHMKSLNEHNEWQYDERFINEPKSLIHHKDFNSYNSNPENLLYMSLKDHSKFHKDNNQNQEVEFSNVLFERYDELFKEDIHILYKDLMFKLNNDKIFMDEYRKINISKNGKLCKIKTNKFRQKIFCKFMRYFGFKDFREYKKLTLQDNIPHDIKNSEKLSSSKINLANKLIYLIKNVTIYNNSLVSYMKENPSEWNEYCKIYNNLKNPSLAGQYQKATTPESKIFDRSSKLIGYKNFKHLVNEHTMFNHKIVKIETIENRDSGTLTIDQEEKYHNYHNFALDAGVYTCNSEDYFLAQRCISFNTLIPLLNGESKTLQELIRDYNSGIDNWVYSVDKKSGEFITGKISWAGETRKNAQMVRVYLDNDEYIDCTPDHKFVMCDGSECEAQFLQSNMMLMSRDNIEIKNIHVEWLSKTENTGCLTIEDAGDNHNFAVDAGVYICNSDGRGSKVETLPGGAGLGELTDLEYFKEKVSKGLRIPLSYTRRGQEGALFNDGKSGQAFIEELRFAQFVERLQGQMERVLDEEFKKYLRTLRIKLDDTAFRLRLPPPSNFAKYRQAATDAELLSLYSSADSIPYISKRFALKRYLQFTDEELIENERLKVEEIDKKLTDSDMLKTVYGGGELGDEMVGGELGGELGAEGEMLPDEEGLPEDDTTEPPIT